MKTNAHGHLEIGGCDVCELAKLSSYPIYLLDEARVRANMQAYVKGLRNYYGSNFSVYYACKALMNLAVCKIAESEQFGLDVASGGELYTALAAQFPSEKIIFHGNNKSKEELAFAIENHVGRIVIDSLSECELLDAITTQLGISCDVLVRVKPGKNVETHKYISTGSEDSKFGLSIQDGTAEEAIQFIGKTKHIKFKGIHAHIGSQILTLTSFHEALASLVTFFKKLSDEGIAIEEFNFGGGLGIPYQKSDLLLSIDDFLKNICSAVREEFHGANLPLPKLMLEPGRSIVGDAGTTLYHIGSTKPMKNGLLYAAVNGGLADNIRPALYQAKYRAVLANRHEEEKDCKVRVVGKCCESGDVLIDEIDLPSPRPGDVLVVFSTGAYNYSMASNFNRLPVPGMLLLFEGKHEWVVKPQTYEDILRHDLIPLRLQ